MVAGQGNQIRSPSYRIVVSAALDLQTGVSPSLLPPPPPPPTRFAFSSSVPLSPLEDGLGFSIWKRETTCCWSFQEEKVIIIGTADVFGVVVCIEARLILGGMAGMYGSYMSYERGCLRGWV